MNPRHQNGYELDRRRLIFNVNISIFISISKKHIYVVLKENNSKQLELQTPQNINTHK